MIHGGAGPVPFFLPRPRPPIDVFPRIVGATTPPRHRGHGGGGHPITLSCVDMEGRCEVFGGWGVWGVGLGACLVLAGLCYFGLSRHAMSWPPYCSGRTVPVCYMIVSVL